MTYAGLPPTRLVSGCTSDRKPITRPFGHFCVQGSLEAQSGYQRLAPMIIQRGTLVRLKKQGGPIHHSFMVSNAFSLGSATNEQCRSCKRSSCQVLFKWCVFLNSFLVIFQWRWHLMVMKMKTRMMIMMMMMMLAQLNLVLFRLNGFIVFIP